MNFLSLLIVLLLAAGSIACQSISPEAKDALDKPVNCASAQRDMATLERERASVAKQVGAGVGSVMPVSAVAKILSGTYSDGVQVATGRYNADIEKKQQQISNACGVPVPPR
jgi:hypothetical protein